MKLSVKNWVICILIIGALTACESNPKAQTTNNGPKPELQFVDLQSFDGDLSNSLSTPLEKVEVGFYDKVSPSALPIRLQTWLSSVESGGGKVSVIPPKSDISAKDPFLLLSLASSLWSASKAAKEAAAQAVFKSAHAYDAEVLLKSDSSGQSIVDKVVFVKRTK